MPQEACFRNIFELNSPVFTSKSTLPVSQPHLIDWEVPVNTGRPFIPYCGYILNVDGVAMPDSIANNQNNAITFVHFFKECRLASINYYDDLPGSTIDSEYFKGYLAKKTFADVDSNYRRYIAAADIIWNFWNNANLAWSNSEYISALDALSSKIANEFDKSLYIPNAIYDFLGGSDIDTDLDAWFLANPNFAGFLTVEFYQGN